jgi:hypothetical protein
LWIDHTRAHFVELDERGAVAREHELISDVESRHRAMGTGGVGPAPAHTGGNPESHYQQRRAQELQRYYERVIAVLDDLDLALVIGPGEAKQELRRAMRRHPQVAAKCVGFEPADKLTAGQIAARARQAFRLT